MKLTKKILTGKKKSSTKKKRELLGQGTFGCVYKPAFMCSPSNSINNKMVSKVMLSNNANEEKYNFSIIDKIDPTGKYHIKLEGECDLSNNNKTKILESGECDIITNYNKNKFKQLKFLDGGKELYYYYSKIKDLINKKTKITESTININKLYKILIAYKNIVEGIVLLTTNNYCHFDIKLENIIYNTNNNVMKLIDFGVSLQYNIKISVENIKFAKEFDYYYKPFFVANYETYPYELILLKYNIFKYSIINFNNINKVINKIKKSYKEFDKENAKYNYILKKSVLKYYIKLIRKLVDKYNNIDVAYIAFMKIIFSKLDLYSIGVTLNKIMTKYYILYNKFLPANNIYKKDFNKLEKICSYWINGLLEPKILNRWDAKKSLKEYNKIYTYCINKI
jgi:serine/threonine protein kinase